MGMREHLDEREVIRRKMLIERSEEKFFFTVFFSVKHSKNKQTHFKREFFAFTDIHTFN